MKNPFIQLTIRTNSVLTSHLKIGSKITMSAYAIGEFQPDKEGSMICSTSIQPYWYSVNESYDEIKNLINQCYE